MSVMWRDLITSAIPSVSVMHYYLIIHPHLAYYRLPDERGMYPIHYAAQHTSSIDGLDMLFNLIRLRVDLDAQTHRGETPMMLVDTVRGLKELLKAGANVKMRDDGGCNALHVFCERNRPDLAKCMIGTGIDPKQRDYSGRIPRTIMEYHTTRKCSSGWYDVYDFIMCR